MSVLEFALALLVTLAMFAQGLDLDLAKLSETLRAPRTLFWGLALNALLLPLAALALIPLFGLGGSLAAALLLCAAAPGGGTGGLLAASVRGDMALATALQVLLAASMLLTPFWLAIGLTQIGDSGAVVRAALLSVLVYQWLPLGAGLALRRQSASLARTLHPWAKNTANFLLLGLIVVLLWRDGVQALSQSHGELLAISAAVLVCFAAASLLPANPAERATLCMVTVNRNLSLALLLAASVLRDDGALMLILFYALVMYLACALYIARMRLAQ